MTEPKILFVDIETKPIISYTWGIWDQNVGLNQIKEDWSIIAWSAKWKGSKKLYYQDLRGKKALTDDKELLAPLWKLLDSADIVVGQNSKEFDAKKLNARFIYHGFQPPTPYIHLDTLQIARRHFGFTSNKLEYLAKTLGTKHQKLVNRKFNGFDLWSECMAGNVKAWKEMEKYNKIDVLALEEVFDKLAPWGVTTNFSVFRDDKDRCNCGSKRITSKGYRTTLAGRYKRYRCNDCGATFRGSKNLIKPNDFLRRIA